MLPACRTSLHDVRRIHLPTYYTLRGIRPPGRLRVGDTVQKKVFRRVFFEGGMQRSTDQVFKKKRFEHTVCTRRTELALTLSVSQSDQPQSANGWR